MRIIKYYVSINRGKTAINKREKVDDGCVFAMVRIAQIMDAFS